ncbi:Nuclear protein export factor [Handroanthus impetiginosus]|uniref:Nuclear protein export factor n=1 Tax=Handroanthus impetiginosus TaxID=429701 RepID=A0A2G9GRS2_9LAMI|nr:Nuclear protein export factor [Handroanthus impetiginosus]
MAFRGFGKNSGPSTQPRAETPVIEFPRPPSRSLPMPISPRSNEPALLPRFALSNPRTASPPKIVEVQYGGRTNSSYSQSADEILRNTRGVGEIPLDFPSGRKGHLVPYRGRSPPLVSQNNLYVGDQHPRNEEEFSCKLAFSLVGAVCLKALKEFLQQSLDNGSYGFTYAISLRTISSSVWGNQSKSSNHNTSPPAQGISSVSATGGTYLSGPVFQNKHADVPYPKRTRSPTLQPTWGVSPENAAFRADGHKRSLIDYRDLDAPEAMPSPLLAFESSFSSRDASRPSERTQNIFSSSPVWSNQSKPSGINTSPVVQEETPSVLTKSDTYQSGRTFTTTHADVTFPKRTRSPTLSSGGFQQNPDVALDGNKRAPGFQSQRQFPTSGQTDSVEVAMEKPAHLPSVKRTKIPFLSSSNQGFQENLDPAEEIERHSTVRNQNVPGKRQHQSMPEKQKFSEDPTMHEMGDFAGGNVSSEYEGMASSSCIVGLCPDMCPESERAERERKGDLDQYERLDGDRNLTTEFLAVKKYTRTAEREAELIRPMPVLQKTMEYLLDLLDEPYDDRFLSLYNFLWDRMRAIRMDLRMQHIFNLEAISMLEQMIRLHIIAMHELCEYTKGEGFSEGFDAHLNIEQMNKTSVELFQFYDDHRKKGIHVPSEREFRGYYALLKLDKHPGYKVEPAELSLDLAKMTPEMRQTPEVLFARDVARACRTGNFIAFFRLARKASYLQACLMHAHFSKLRTQALASLHSGLQVNQGIPVVHVAKWLGMEEEDIEALLEYHGFSIKDFEEPYMVKENAFINVDNDFPVKRSILVERKRSKMIASDVSFPSTTNYAAEDVKEFQLKKDPKPIPTPVQSDVPLSTTPIHDEEMQDSGNVLSPKGSLQKPMHEASIGLVPPAEKMAGHEIPLASPSPLVLDFPNNSSAHHQSRFEFAKQPKYEPVFRNSFGRSVKHDLEATAQITVETPEENGYTSLPFDAVDHTPIPQPMFTEELEDEDQPGTMEDDKSDEVTNYYDKEVVDAKLKLILRLLIGAQSVNYGTFNIDNVMSERQEVQERSWSVLNPSDVVAAKLVEKNPTAKCLCWKLVLCSQGETLNRDNIELQDETAPSGAGSWLHSKLLPTHSDDNGDLLVSSPGLAIWRSWIPTQSGVDSACCLSVIKSTTSKDPSKAITGASAVLFLLSEHIPPHLQKKRLHDLIMSLPSGSHLPLLILSGSGKDESDPSTIAKDLELHDIDKSRVHMFHINFIKDKDTKKLDRFFSDKHLREGLEWLAIESPPQIVVSRTKTRELVLSHLNSTLEVLDEMDTHRVGPSNCISAFNEALDQSIKEVAAAAHANPTGWPSPEIDLLDDSSDEYRAAAWLLPSIGWSSHSRIEMLTHALNESKLPVLGDDLSWLYRGVNAGDDIENLKSCLENCIIDYLTEISQMMGVSIAQKEAGIMLQSYTLLELHNTTYYIIPKWVSIFRRIFSWRLMNLNCEEVSSTYVLVQHHLSTLSSRVQDYSESKVTTFLPPYVVHPSLDELVEVGCHPQESWLNHMQRNAFQPQLPISSDGADVPIPNNNVTWMENEKDSSPNTILTSYDHSAIGENKDGGQPVHTSNTAKEANKLSKLLEKCNIMQDLIDKKLAIYF